MFNGRNLGGWVTRGGRYDGNAKWSVEDGVITGREGPKHAGGLLYTERAYGSFDFSCDVRMTYPFDSGIFVRMVPRGGGKGAQVTLDYRPTGEVGAIYADGFLQHDKTSKEKFRRDDWNRVEVRCTGHFRIEVWLNGEKITDYTLPPGTDGYAKRGLIGVQVHGSRNDPPGSNVQFKNVRVRELPEFDAAYFEVDARGLLVPAKAGAAKGWRLLFNGRDLDGWQEVGGKGGYAVRDGMLALLAEGGSSHIITAEDFRDFELRLDFKIARMCNSGLFLRAARGRGNPAYSGCEVQILDDFHWEAVTNTKLKPWQFTGSLYSSVPARPGALKPNGEWNTYEVTYRGTRLKVVLNGVEMYDVDTLKVPLNGARPFAERAATGFVGLQRHAPREVRGEAYAWFRNIMVRPLPAEKTEDGR